MIYSNVFPGLVWDWVVNNWLTGLVLWKGKASGTFLNDVFNFTVY